MQNFGRGMWRRIGDFEKFNVPQINNNEVQQYLYLMEKLKKQRLAKLDEHQQQTIQIYKDTADLLVKEELEFNNDETFNDLVTKEVITEAVQEAVQEVIQEVIPEVVPEVVQEVVPELIKIIPKKSKK